MKKTYTKKQIQEAIVYWKKQLVNGNYRKVNEAEDNPDAEDAAETAIVALDELAGALDPEYEDPNSLYLSFTGKDDYYSKLDRISDLLTGAGLKYNIDYPEDDDDDGWASVLVHVRWA